MVWRSLQILWHHGGKDDSAENRERNKKDKKTEEEMGRQRQIIDMNWV